MIPSSPPFSKKWADLPISTILDKEILGLMVLNDLEQCYKNWKELVACPTTKWETLYSHKLLYTKNFWKIIINQLRSYSVYPIFQQMLELSSFPTICEELKNTKQTSNQILWECLLLLFTRLRLPNTLTPDVLEQFPQHHPFHSLILDLFFTQQQYEVLKEAYRLYPDKINLQEIRQKCQTNQLHILDEFHISIDQMVIKHQNLLDQYNNLEDPASKSDILLEIDQIENNLLEQHLFPYLCDQCNHFHNYHDPEFLSHTSNARLFSGREYLEHELPLNPNINTLEKCSDATREILLTYLIRNEKKNLIQKAYYLNPDLINIPFFRKYCQMTKHIALMEFINDELTPLIERKRDILKMMSDGRKDEAFSDELEQIEVKLIQSGEVKKPYFCTQCQKNHSSGSLYTAHKTFAQVQIPSEKENELRSKIRELSKTFADPFCNTKRALYLNMYEIQRELVQNYHSPYFCAKCQKIHKVGPLQHQHIEDALIYLVYPPLKVSEFERTISFTYTAGPGAFKHGCGGVILKQAEDDKKFVEISTNYPYEYIIKRIEDPGLLDAMAKNIPITKSMTVMSNGRESRTRWDSRDECSITSESCGAWAKGSLQFLDHYRINEMLKGCQELLIFGYPKTKLIQYLTSYNKIISEIFFGILEQKKDGDFSDLAFVLSDFQDPSKTVDDSFDFHQRYQIAKNEIEMENLLNTFKDPMVENKAQRMQTLRELNLKILTLKKLSYTCKICKEIHQPDNLSYLIHLPYADLPPLNFPTNTYPKCEHIIHTQIVGVFYTNNGDYLKKLPSRTELSLHTEPENSHDSYAVSVWHNDKKCGYIPKEKNREIFTAITSNEKVKCILGRYHPKVDAKKVFHKHRTSHDREDRDFFDDYDDDFYGNYEEVQKFQPERADTTITIVDYTTIKKVFDALVELNELGYPHLEQDFDRIGPNALSYLVWYANKSKAAERLLAIVQAHYQITTSQGYSLLH